jgi:hypothetical protein
MTARIGRLVTLTKDQQDYAVLPLIEDIMVLGVELEIQLMRCWTLMYLHEGSII